MNKSEHVGVTVATVLMSIVATIFLTVAIPLISLKSTVLDLSYLSKLFTSTAGQEMIADTFDEAFITSFREEGYNIDSDTKVLSDDSSEMLSEFIAALIEGEDITRAETDKLSDSIFNDVIIFMEECDEVPDEALEDFKREYAEQPLFDFDDLHDSFTSSGTDNTIPANPDVINLSGFGLTESFAIINTVFGVIGYALLAVGIILFIITIAIHKRKYRGIRAVGICLTVAGAFDSLFAFISKNGFAAMVNQASSSDIDELGEEFLTAINSFVSQLFSPVLYICLALLAIGVVIIVAATAFAKTLHDNTVETPQVEYTYSDGKDNPLL